MQRGRRCLFNGQDDLFYLLRHNNIRRIVTHDAILFQCPFDSTDVFLLKSITIASHKYHCSSFIKTNESFYFSVFDKLSYKQI